MNYKFFIIILLFVFKGYSQDGFAIGGGLTMNYLQFQPFETYVVSYNTVNAASTGFTPLKYNPYGFGYHGFVQYRIGKLYSAINILKTNAFNSKANFDKGKREFDFKNYTFDVNLGCKIKSITPYITLSINSLNIESFFKYATGERSYGSEFGISGVYSSFRMFSGLGLRYEKKVNRMGWCIDACYPLNAKHYLGGSFDKQTNATNAISFPQDHANYGTMETDLFMPETYRNIRLNLGLIFYLNQGE